MTPAFLKVRPDYLKIPLIYTPGIRLESAWNIFQPPRNYSQFAYWPDLFKYFVWEYAWNSFDLLLKIKFRLYCILVKIQTGYRRNMLQKYVPFPPGNQAGIFIRAGLPSFPLNGGLEGWDFSGNTEHQ